MTEIDKENVRLVEEFVTRRCNPFDSSSSLVTLVSKKEFDKETVAFILTCLIKREEQYQLFRTERINTRKKRCLIRFQNHGNYPVK